MDRQQIADLICHRLDADRARLTQEFADTARIQSFVVDDLLPVDLAHRIHDAFPAPEAMRLQRSRREDKYTAFQMDRYPPLLGEAVYAFQEQRVVDLVSTLSGIQDLHGDDSLYLGGVSLMGSGQFLNPHIDNSHNDSFTRYRRLNLLYYVTPEWKLEDGGNFELWDRGLKAEPRTVVSQFNRLVVMATTRRSLHSVSPITGQERARCCVSNYFFSEGSADGTTYNHGTYFRGRPEQPWRDLILRAEIGVKRLVRRVTGTGRADRTHVSRRSEPD